MSDQLEIVGAGAALEPAEQARLAELEAVVEAGLQTFVDVGRALLEIRDERLYRQTHATFEDYCRARWQMTRRHANRLVQASAVAELMGPMGPIPNERQARELVPLLDDEAAVVDVYRELCDRYGGDKVTAERIRRVVTNRIERVERETARAERQASGEPVDDVEIRYGDFREALAELDGDVDAIIADPHYTTEWLERDAEAFAAVAARMLRPSGRLVVLYGVRLHYALKPVLDRCLRYRWTGAYYMPGWSARVFGPRLATNWKPLLVYARRDAPAFEFLTSDVVVSDGADKRFHYWGQSESGTAALVERFTLAGELVVDPFLGGGTTAVVCRDLGRRFIGCDVDAEAVDKTKARLAA